MDFNCGDIRALLDARPRKPNGEYVTGPLLACVVNGIDTMGGLIYGFEDKRDGGPGSEERAERFMRDHMKLDARAAELLYHLAGCGMSHEAAPKTGLGVRVDYAVGDDQLFHRFRKDLQHIVHLNVVELAKRFLQTVETIGNNRGCLQFIPSPPKTKLDDALWNDVPYYPKEKSPGTTTRGAEPQSSSRPDM